MGKRSTHEKVNIELKRWQVTIGVIVTVCGVVASVFNFTISYKFYPVWEALRMTQARVEAIEADRVDVPQWREAVTSNSIRVNSLEVDIGEIKSDVKDIRAYLLGK